MTSLVPDVAHIIVNRGDWFCSSANIKGANKDAKIYVGKSMTVHNLFFCAHTLRMNYVTNTFLSVRSSVRSKQLLSFVHGQGQKREQKHTTKKFLRFHNHSPLLTMPTFTVVYNRPFPSSYLPPLQSDSRCEVFLCKLVFIHKEVELITITKTSHLDSL